MSADAKLLPADLIEELREVTVAYGWTDLTRRLDAAQGYVGERFVWAVGNKTSFALFASEEAACRYINCFPASVAGGMGISKLAVLHDGHACENGEAPKA